MVEEYLFIKVDFGLPLWQQKKVIQKVESEHLLKEISAHQYANKYTTDYPKFWSSGGVCNSESCSTNEWEIDVRELPEIYRKYAAEIDRIFNDNVPHGCCGGCL